MKNKLLFTTALVAAAMTASVSYAAENKVYEGNYSSSETRVTDAAGEFTIRNVTASGVFQEGQDYVRNGIFGTLDAQGYNTGNATFTGTANITNGGGIEVGKVEVSDGAVINISGQNDLLPGAAEDNRKDYHKGSILAGYDGIAINGGTINLSDGGMLIAGTKEKTADFKVNSGTINVDNSFLIADTTDGKIEFNGADAIKTAETEAQNAFVGSLNKISASDLESVTDTLGDQYGTADNVVQAKIDAYVDGIKGKLSDEPRGDTELTALKKALGKNADTLLKDVNDDAELKAWLEENELTKDDFEKDEAYKSQTGDKVENALVDAYNNDADTENKPALTWGALSEDAQKKAEAQIDAAKNAATPTINLTGNNRLVGAVDMEASVMNLKNGTTTADGAVTLGEDAVANIDGTLKADKGTQLNDGAVVNLTGTMDSNVTVEQNANVNVNGSEAFIQKLAGDGTLNINANTSVSTLFGSASKIGTLAVKEGSTFILDSLDEVKENVSEGIEAKDAVNLEAGTMDVLGTAIVADNNANKITNTNVNKGGILDLGYNTFESEVTMDAGSTLNVGVKNAEETETGELTHGKIDGTLTVKAPADGAANASMNLIIAADTKFGDESKIDLASGSDLSNLVVNNNLLYNLEGVEDGKITGTEIKVSKKDSSEVAAGVAANGANGNQAGTIAAFVDGLSGNAQADNITNQISTLVQSGNVKGAARLAKEVAPVAAPVAQSQVTETTNQVFGAVATRLSGGSVSSAAEGKSSGDSVFERAAMWVQGLFNKSKYDGSNDFKTDSTGLALGAEKYLNSDVKVGAGYAYTNSDVKQGDRKIDVDTHTAFVYGEYKPSDWYVNGIASYNWGDYDEKKYGGLSGKYDVNSIALQAMTGYDFHMNGAVVTPEAGLRYINIHQDSYTDTAGQRVSENSSDYLTGIVGAKIKKDYTLSNGMNIRPEARLAMTYDLVNDNSNASVMLANGSAYQVRGEALDRFGVEAGVGLTAEVDDNVEVSLGYEGKFRDHYKDHTGLLNAKYKF